MTDPRPCYVCERAVLLGGIVCELCAWSEAGIEAIFLYYRIVWSRGKCYLCSRDDPSFKSDTALQLKVCGSCKSLELPDGS